MIFSVIAIWEFVSALPIQTEKCANVNDDYDALHMTVTVCHTVCGGFQS